MFLLLKVVEFPAGGEAFPVLYRCPFRDNIKRDFGLYIASIVLLVMNIFAYVHKKHITFNIFLKFTK